MTEFEIIKAALARIRADCEIYDFPTEKSIVIPINTIMANGVAYELEFDANGKLKKDYVWD